MLSYVDNFWDLRLELKGVRFFQAVANKFTFQTRQLFETDKSLG